MLALWLKDEKLTSRPLTTLKDLIKQLTPTLPYKGAPYIHGLDVKLIGPTGSGTLRDLVRESQGLKQKPLPLLDDIDNIQVYSPSATISNCDLLNQEGSQTHLDCLKNPPNLLEKTTLPIVRTTGTDDVLAASLLWELWQRGVNRDPGYLGSQWKKWVGQNDKCEDGLVLIGERDTRYGRALLQYLTDGFSDRCGSKKQVRTFSYLRGLDGVLADADKSGNKAPPKNDSGKSKDLREQLEDAPLEHAEGRSQFDYLRRLADEIDQLDGDKTFAEHGVKAIGLVGSDLYDKLLILQALRNRFKTKIFFTTDLDARYLHADQKDWTRNLVVASNFGLSLDLKLQEHILPFRDSYQTARYLATLMALKDQPFDWTHGTENWQPSALQQSIPPYQPARYFAPMMVLNPPVDWTDKMEKWLRPQIFEIGRTEAVHIASPSIERLKCWTSNKYSEDSLEYINCMKNRQKLLDRNGIEKEYSEGSDFTATKKPCASDWWMCESIKPDWPLRSLSPMQLLGRMLLLLGTGIPLIILANRHVNKAVRVASGPPSTERAAERKAIATVAIVVVVVVFGPPSLVLYLMNNSLTNGIGEPFVWLEGISAWPNLTIRFVGLLTVLGLWCLFVKNMQHQKSQISKDFELPLTTVGVPNRGCWSAVLTGPYLDLAPSKKDGEVTTLWHKYLWATSFREMKWWIGASIVITLVLVLTMVSIWDEPSFPHRGTLVLDLHRFLFIPHTIVFWLIIFWVGYETHACVQFINSLSGVRNKWPKSLLLRKAKETRISPAHLDDYLDFQLIVQTT